VKPTNWHMLANTRSCPSHLAAAMVVHNLEEVFGFP
jgi:hypothetical protein